MLHDLNEKGYTVKELYKQLKLAMKEGMGDRRVYVGPQGGEELNEPTALPIIGVEGNTDKDSSELDILWLYPGDNEWI